jgi:two-component system sensor histidine kinase ResE
VNERPRRFGLQAWLVAAFVAVGTIASLGVMLVVLPTLESSIRNEQVRQAGNTIAAALREREDMLATSVAAEISDLAVEIGGDVRLTPLNGPLSKPLTSQLGQNLLSERLSGPAQDVQDGFQSRVESLTVRGRPVIQAAQLVQVGGLPFVLEVAAPVARAETQIAIVRRRVLIAVAFALFLATLAGIWIARLLGSRIRSLAGTAKTLASGDLAARAADHSPQELTSLGGSLNAMAARLEDLVAETVSDRDRARALVASLAEGVLAVSDRGEVTVANAAAQRLLGLPSGAESMTVDELPPAVRDVVLADRNQDDGQVATEVTLPGGIEALLSVSPLARGAGVVLTMRDVTEERRLARARRDLIANVSHELKTPLTAVKGFMELLENESLGQDRRREFLGLMSQEVGRLERLVAEQLELARLDAGALTLALEPVDLGELASEVAASRRLLAGREGVELGSSLPGVEVVVQADPARIEQILLILLDNAIRHTPSGGKITVGVGIDDGQGTVSVRDTGTGISKDSQQFVFDRFYQADSSREGQGLGLGLAIARGLADAHGGSIEVRSTPQVGSVFTVRLPLAPRPARVEALDHK